MKEYFSKCAIIFSTLFICNGSIAGELSKLSGKPIQGETYSVDTGYKCSHRFTGTFKKGDSKKIINAKPSLLCLDSPGGSFVEALKVTSFMKSEPIATRIESGSRCESACALVFMAGSFHPHESEVAIAWRILHVRGKLGFHSPALIVQEGIYDEKTIQKAYQLAMQSVSKLVFDLVHRPDFGGPSIKTSLLGEMLATPSHSMLYVETVDQAGRWGITIDGLEKKQTPNRKQLAVVCVNLFYWDDDQSAISKFQPYIVDWMTKEQLTEKFPNGTKAEIIMSEMTGSGCAFEVNEKSISVRIKADGRDNYASASALMFFDPEQKLVDLPLASSGVDNELAGQCIIIKDGKETSSERCQVIKSDDNGRLSQTYTSSSGSKIVIESDGASTFYDSTKTSKPFDFDGKTCVINPKQGSLFCYSGG